MNKDVADKLVHALRSGEYKQGRNYLRKGDNFCCLGVLCDLAVKEGVIEDWDLFDRFDGNVFGFVGEVGQTVTGRLPAKVQEWSGMDTDTGHYDYEDGFAQHALASDNDQGKSFATIADTIEANWFTL